MEKERNLASVEERAYQIRIENEYTQKEFAKILDVSISYVSNWENGYNEITIPILNKICNAWNVSFDYMMGFTTKKNNVSKILIVDRKYLGKRLREIRKNENLTQEKMAKKINTYRFLISDYETGRKSISTADLKQICETFGYSADWCVGKISDCIRYKPVHKLKAKDMKELIQVKQKEAQVCSFLDITLRNR